MNHADLPRWNHLLDMVRNGKPAEHNLHHKKTNRKDVKTDHAISTGTVGEAETN